MNPTPPPSINTQSVIDQPLNQGLSDSEKQLRAQVDALQKTIDLITQNTNIVDRFATVKLGMPEIGVWFYGGYMIKSYKKIKDTVDYFSPELKQDKREEQLSEYYFFDETKKPVILSLHTSTKTIEKKIFICEESPVIKKDGNVYYRYKYEGKDYEIDANFIN